tara:strand:- start:199 stop:462 length:264 start_codon:yes stop_codon:yes gene_type:complete
MQNEGWLVKNDRTWAMRFFQDKILDEEGKTYMRVHYASCKNKFSHGITSYVQLHKSEKMTIETARELWKSSIKKEWEVSAKPLWLTR